MKDCLISLLVVISVSVQNTMAQQITGSETREPAFLLRPRNFNPHPYENALLHSAHSQPHIYNHHLAAAAAVPQQYVPIAFGDHHPYNIIKSQRDYLQRPPTEGDHRAFNALAKHAKKILQDPVENINKKYAFTYTANDIYHTQQQDTRGLVKGSYEVPLPDGRIQVVHYTADDNGYHPEISYKDDPAPAPPPQTPTYIQLPTAPVAPRGNVVVYSEEEEEEEAPKSYYSTTVTTSKPHAVQYSGYNGLLSLPKPYGTVKTIGPVLQQVATEGPKYGHIQYATYEDDAIQSNPVAGNVYYEK